MLIYRWRPLLVSVRTQEIGVWNRLAFCAEQKLCEFNFQRCNWQPVLTWNISTAACPLSLLPPPPPPHSYLLPSLSLSLSLALYEFSLTFLNDNGFWTQSVNNSDCTDTFFLNMPWTHHTHCGFTIDHTHNNPSVATYTAKVIMAYNDEVFIIPGVTTYRTTQVYHLYQQYFIYAVLTFLRRCHSLYMLCSPKYSLCCCTMWISPQRLEWHRL